ncbi:transcription antiterminator BglG, partial [Streptococcus pyogenes]
SYLPYRAVIICPNGVSSSLIIKENLKKIFPKIDFIHTSRVEQLTILDETSYDLVFSTVEISSSKPSFLVSVLMTEEQ